MLSRELARAVQDRVLARAPEQTLAQLKAALARAVIAADPDGAESRHREARRDRRVVITPEAEGMASLWALLTATQAAGAFTWLTRLARGLGADDPRNIDTRRADILAAILSGQPVTNPDTGTTPDAATPEGATEDDDSTGDTPTGEADTAPGDGKGGAGDGQAACSITAAPPTTHQPGSPTTSVPATSTAGSTAAAAKPPTPSWITSPPGPTAVPPANPTSPRTAPTTTGSKPTPTAGASTPAPTAG